MSCHAKFVFGQEELSYRFNDDHPFNPKRLELTVDLLIKAGALPDDSIIPPRQATIEELSRVHLPEYIAAVQALSLPNPEERWIQEADRWGLMDEDTPYFEGMHDTTSLLVGGSLEAVDAVMTGQANHALHLGGGLHHAMPNKGGGFCVYNDASVAIAHLRHKYNSRVLYIDTDVHHGDGVQWSFYSDPNVCTFSIHETGKYLFPGTGAAGERGEGEGFGTNINLPMDPYTEDESWMDGFKEVLLKVVDYFKPDVIISQHGCDAHAFDPQAHMHCSMNIYLQMPYWIHEVAHQYCEGRWIALGGGGYEIWRVVPRAWALLWMTMADHPLIATLQSKPLTPLPEEWLKQWQPESPFPLPDTWLDPVEQWEPIPRRNEININNKHSKEVALLYLPDSPSDP
ncbi:acetoin utilization protein AcuC [Paenibacillus sp. J2TS4]|uniref:acetoin utilization protein AcuC n=1 Tax=Paenibacillus sp. J2TS4 TaxID=2807194 RepID=UPI001B0D4224|nr:acetoin utilization protein AcuC [Paenibacillus sp. J2TS4]GIP32900.1 acetoin utilization protein AcuC [Paenibacillus sp. J2TS4]